MTVYQPCLNCPETYNRCPKKREVRQAIRGAGLTLLRFRCDIYRNMFPPGSRVKVMVRYSKANHHYEPTLTSAWWKGTVVGPARARDKWLVFLDDLSMTEEHRRIIRSANNVVPAYARWIRLLDEPRDLGRIQELRRREDAAGMAEVAP